MNKSDKNHNSSTIQQILNYQILETVYSGSRTLVYRAIRTKNRLPVVIKLLKNEYPTFSELVQFRNQYTITKNLSQTEIIQAYSLEPYRNGYALVMEDFGGISLREWAMRKNLQSLQEFLEIAIALCNALDILYRERIIHKDIKPSNILINPETKQVKLIDFSIASLLPRETQTLINPNVLEGTLAYISPEQTGRMNRGIDYRTDFYSLGVTFFELLTGKLPFESNEPMELVHSHIAKMPRALENREQETGNRESLPQVICDIVMKLMAKNAEERYQSALGLKYDLEKCLHQLQENGEIKDFPIAQRDVCDRFIIPDKLYGRETEVETLLQAFERVSRGATEMMLVAGFSGIGKTAVVNEVHKPIVRQRGYFIKGKFDQFQRNIPFSAFVQAFRDLMGQLLTESDVQLEQWKNQILETVGDNGQVIIEVIPELEKIIGEQPPAVELSGTAAQNRFNLLFQKFTQVFTSASHPLVIFLDDLQWADSASLKLIQLLMADTGHLFIIGAYRDNEVNLAHPLMLTLSEIQKNKATINTITLTPLSQSQIDRLVADTLKSTENLALHLSQLVYQKTKGNPFFATQFLKALHEENLIQFNLELSCWQCDLSKINQQALTDDVVEFMALQLEKLALATQNILKLAACIGNQFDLATLAIVSEHSEVETAANLWKALQEGLILPLGDVYKFYVGAESQAVAPEKSQNVTYKFLHDRVQQAAYSLIPDDQKQATHLKIGRLLQQNLSEIEKEEKIFDIVGHLNLGIELITQSKNRQALAQLNLAAGQKAKHSTAYSAARSFVRTGLELLGADCWQTQYELTLDLHVTAAETAYLNGDFDGMKEMADRVLRSAQTILDKVKIYEIQVSALTTQSQMLEAIAVGINALADLGIELSSEPNEASTGIALQTLASQLEGKPISELINLPEMRDRETIAGIQLLAMLFSAIFAGSPALLPLYCSTMVSLSLQFGNAPASTIGYVGYGMVLAAFLGEVKTGYEFGRLSRSLLKQLNAREFKSSALLFFGAFLQHRQEPLRAVIPTLKDSYLAGMETGDFLCAGYSIAICFYDHLFSGLELDDWESEIKNYCNALETVKQNSPLAYLKATQQTVQNLRKIVERADLLIGTAYDETVMFPKHHQDNELTILAVVYDYKLMLAYLFGNYTNALDYIAQANRYLMAATGMIQIPIFHFYAGLTYLALYSTQSEIEQPKTLALLETHQTTLTQWAHHAPMNHQHKVDLIKAEKCRVLGQKAEAIELYDKAISGAKANEYIQDEALGNELAARFYLVWGKPLIAQSYMINAYYGYARWGAKAKVASLENRYPQLLAPILQPTRPILSASDTLVAIGTVASTSSSGTSISNSLDLAAILKASQTISGEIELEKLLSSLLSIIIENAGADKCVLMLLQDEQLLIQGSITEGTNPVVLQNLRVEESQDIPLKLIYKVKHNKQTVVLLDATADPILANDPYIIRQQPKSILCSPILHQGKLIGILYLENNLTTGAFTRDRVELLNLLCAQAAISIENAQLYERSLEYSQQLEQSVDRLSAAKSRLQASQQRLQLLVEQTPVAVIEWDINFLVTDWNPAAERIFGYTKQEALGHHFTFIVPEAIQAQLKGVSAEIISQQGGNHSINENLTKDGKTIICAWYNNVLVNADGELIGVASLADDISDRKRAELAYQQKSVELEQALHNLQNAQLQIIQNEKMSALGNLVAGVAHEMNNPLGFIAASLLETKPTIAELIEHLQLYQETFPNKSEKIIDHAEEIDLEYTLEDLPKIMDSMSAACDRLKNISTSLRIFSRADRDYKVPFNIHEGIDSTILILKHRLKANDQRPAIEVITNYGILPQIECFPGQLNQVFMNIIANAIDALDEANAGRSFEDIKNNPNRITITTSMADNFVKIAIADNGQGMSEELKPKIFDHLFTTKTVGKGTGLGLAIAKSIVVEKHGGTIDVNSLSGQGTKFVIELPIKE